MADLNWNDVVEQLPAEAKQELLTLLDDAGLTATSWQEGAIAPTLVEIGADFRARGSRIAVFLKNAFFATQARGDALTETSRGFYENERNPEIAAQLLVTLDLAVGEGPHTFDVGELVFGHPDGGTYRNVAGNSIVYPYTLNGGTSVTLLVEAEVGGSAGNIADKTDDEVELELNTTLSGVTVAENELERSGVDEESDDALEERDTTKWPILSEYGIIDDHVIQICRNASPSIVRVAVDSTNPRGAGTFDVYIGGQDTTASDIDVGLAQAAVQRRIFNGASAVRVRKATEVPVDIAGQVFFASSYSESLVRTQVESDLLSFVRTVPIGGFVFEPPGPQNQLPLNDLEAVIRKIKIEGAEPVRTVILTVPAANILLPKFGMAVRPVGGWSTTLAYLPTTG